MSFQKQTHSSPSIYPHFSTLALTLSLFRSVDLAGRAMHLSAGIAKIAADLAREDGGPPPSPPSPSQSSSSSALPDGAVRGDGQLLDESRGQSTGELLISLSAVCSSFATATLGLGEPPRAHTCIIIVVPNHYPLPLSGA